MISNPSILYKSLKENVLRMRMDGNKAIAYAALDAGTDYFTHYPGSPVNRVEVEFKQAMLTENRNVSINDALNEHVSALAAAGASMCGARSLVVMKHMGLNIAADPLSFIGYTNIKGGMVVVVGTDPGARSSTGEQDVHGYASQFNAPSFEPASVQGIYDCVFHAFAVSEKAGAPVLVFVPGRIAYQSECIQRENLLPNKSNDYSFIRNRENYINVGDRAVKNHQRLIERIEVIAKTPASICYKQIIPNAKIGIITRGTTWAPTCEVLQKLQLTTTVSHLNIERLFPIDMAEVLAFTHGLEKLIIIEDQDGYLEQQIKFRCFNEISCKIFGKSHFPAWGEISYDKILSGLLELFNLPVIKERNINLNIPQRPGTYCEGCPHRGAYWGIEQALKGREYVLGGDIGCSSLPPFKADWLLCMNAGVGMSQGISQVSNNQTVVSIGGEGSLFHGGLISLQNAVENNIKLVHVLLDNQAVAMTGHQPSPTTTGNVDILLLLKAIGVNEVFEVNAFKPTEVQKCVEKAIKINGVSVVWVRGNCALLPNKETIRIRQVRTLKVDVKKCLSCTRCHSELDCPAIQGSSQDLSLFFDMTRCNRCAACLDICPNDAILVTEKELV